MNKPATTKSTTSFRKPESNTVSASTANNNSTFSDSKKEFKKNRKIGNLFKSKNGNPCIGIDTYPEDTITLKKGQYIFLKKKENIIEQIEKDLMSDKLSEKARGFLEKRLERLKSDDKLIAELEIVTE